MSGKVIFIIGGMCCGKSYVSKKFETYGAHFIDLDFLARKVYNAQEIRDRLESACDCTFFDSDGHLIREALREYLFESKEHISNVNRIIHPIVKKLLDRQIREIEDDVPIVVEYSAYFGQSRTEDMFLKDANFIIFVDCADKIRENRFKNRGSDLNLLKKVIEIQPLRASYEKVCDVIFDNSFEGVSDERLRQLWLSCQK